MSTATTPPSASAGFAAPGAVQDVDLPAMSLDTAGPIRLGIAVLVLGLGGFLAWAALAPLDEGVSAPATVSIDTRRRAIQHMTGGVVRTLMVKEGQVVKQDEVLLVLEEASTRAAMESVRQTYLSQRAAEGRLLAELAGQAQIAFHPDLAAGAQDPLVQQHMSTQNQLFVARRAALLAELSSIQDAIAGARAQITGLGAMLESRQAQARSQVEHLARMRGLADQGYAPRNQVLQMEQGLDELQATLADLQASRKRAEQQVAELTGRMAQRRQEYQKEAGAQLAEVRREVQANHERLTAVNDELRRVAVKSPVAGQVVGLMAGSLGAVVTPGQKLMDIVPKGEPLLLEARIPTHVIDRVRVGQHTDVRFSSFANSPQLVVGATLESVSGDAVSEAQPMGTVTYYLGRVRLTADGVQALAGREMQPGMPAEVLVKTGERSLLTYLLHPLLRRLSTAMKEE